MTIRQCQQQAREMIVGNSFEAAFPIGTRNCEWIDAWMGFVRIEHEGLEESLISVDQIKSLFHGLECRPKQGA